MSTSDPASPVSLTDMAWKQNWGPALTLPSCHPLCARKDPRCHKVQGHTANQSGAGLRSGLRLQAGSPAPSSPGLDRTKGLTASGCRPRSLRWAQSAAARRAQNRSCCLVSRATDTGHFRCRAALRPIRAERSALVGGTGGQRAHAPLPVPAFLSAALAPIHPISAELARVGPLRGTSQCTS